MDLRALVAEDVPAARALLAAHELPTDDLADAAVTLVGAFERAELLGVIGLQPCGRCGLLRSLTVEPSARRRGVARALCTRVIDDARALRLDQLWLLTTTAREYFARIGFVPMPRTAAPTEIQETRQFRSLCPSSAVVMVRAV